MPAEQKEAESKVGGGSFSSCISLVFNSEVVLKGPRGFWEKKNKTKLKKKKKKSGRSAYKIRFLQTLCANIYTNMSTWEYWRLSLQPMNSFKQIFRTYNLFLFILLLRKLILERDKAK